MNIIIVGCGNTGSRLANTLDENGYDVAVIDINKNSFELLSEDFSGLCICGTATDVETLKNAGCDNADMAVVVTDSDNVNIMVAKVLDFEFSIDNTFVRVSDPSREAVFRKLGLKTVSPTRIESNIFLSLLTDDSDGEQSISLNQSTIRFVTVKAEKKHKDMLPSEIPCKSGEMLFAIRKKDGSVHFTNETHLYIDQGDKLIYAKMS